MAYFNYYRLDWYKMRIHEFAFEFIVICGATLFPVVKQLLRYTVSTY